MIANQSYEVEIKVLLQQADKAQALEQKLAQNDPNLKLVDTNSQLNHYFLVWNFEKLIQSMAKYLNDEQMKLMKDIAYQGKNHSVRTRDADSRVYFVIKAVADDTDAFNWTWRIEFEVQLDNITIDELDKILLDADFPYQSKWSRQRKEYKYKDYNVCLDKNAWYWYLAEFEKILDSQDQIEDAKLQIRDELDSLGIQELNQERLWRMFKYYNENWPNYYWTENVFNIE